MLTMCRCHCKYAIVFLFIFASILTGFSSLNTIEVSASSHDEWYGDKPDYQWNITNGQVISKPVFAIKWDFWGEDEVGLGRVFSFNVSISNKKSMPIIKTNISYYSQTQIFVLNYTSGNYDMIYTENTFSYEGYLHTNNLPSQILLNLTYFGIKENTTTVIDFVMGYIQYIGDSITGTNFIDSQSVSFFYGSELPVNALNFIPYFIGFAVVSGGFIAGAVYYNYYQKKKQKERRLLREE